MLYNCVLVVSDSELDWETMKLCCWRLPRWENRPENPRDWIWLTGPGLPEGWVNVKKLTIINYKYDIRILLINTIILIYICHIYLKIVVLVVSNSELNSGDDKVVSSEVSEAGEWARKLRGDM